MFGIDGAEFLLFAAVALLIIGPKDLPKAMRVVGNFVGKARAMSRHFRSGLDAMVREAELEEMEKKWKAENERIMREYSDPLAIKAPEPAPVLEAPAEALPPPHALDAPADASPPPPAPQVTPG